MHSLVLKVHQLISCIERDTNELMKDLQYFRDFVENEFCASSEKIRKRSEKIDNFKQFTQALINEGPASSVADVASILNQRASEIQVQSRKSGIGKRPLVEVMFQPLGLCRLSQAKNRRKINLVGRVTASIITSKALQSRSSGTPTIRLPTETAPEFPTPVFHFGTSSSSGESVSRYLRAGRLRNARIKASQTSGMLGRSTSHDVEVMFQPLGRCHLSQVKNGRKINPVRKVIASVIPSEVLQSGSCSTPTIQLPAETALELPRPVFNFGTPSSSGESISKNQRSGRLQNAGIKASQNSVVFRRSKLHSDIDDMIRQTGQSNKDSSLSSSSDEDDTYNIDEDAVSSTEAVTEDSATAQKTLPDSVEDFSSSSSTVIFSHRAKLSRFVNGSWRTCAIGNLELLRLQDKNTVFLSMKNGKVCYVVIVSVSALILLVG